MRKVRRIVTFVCLGAAGLAGTARAQQAFPRYDHVFIHMMEKQGLRRTHRQQATRPLSLSREQVRFGHPVCERGRPQCAELRGHLGRKLLRHSTVMPLTGATQLTNRACSTRSPPLACQWRAYVQSMPYPDFWATAIPTAGSACLTSIRFTPASTTAFSISTASATSAGAEEDGSLTPFFTDVTANPPNFGWIAPDMCHDMHGAPVYCTDSGDDG